MLFLSPQVKNNLFFCLALVFTLMRFGVAKTCANSQILLNNECIDAMFTDCNTLLPGCNQCSLRSDSVQSLQCDTCDFGYYLLSVNTNDAALNGRVSLCVERCEDFAYNWVSNPDTMHCEYCGLMCTLCSPKHGCLADYRWDHSHKYVSSESYPTAQFPFSSKPPSTEFVTTKECADPRCDKCQNLDAEKPNASSQYLECDSCFAYVNENLDGKQALLNCQLCDSTSVSNCLNCDPDFPNICISCKQDFYIDKSQNQCLSCASDLKLASGCKRCSADSCLECMPGYYEVVNGGRRTCEKCALDTFNAAYSLEPNRCTQCLGQSAPDKCKYCDIGFLGSLSNPESCELKCDPGQYPVVTFVEQNDNENQLSTTHCAPCDSSCSSCIGLDSTLCTKCPAGSYLEISDKKRLTGSCQAQKSEQASFDIYVSNLSPTAALAQLSQLMEENTIGSFENPFYHIDDALERAKELAIPYLASVTVQVTVHLYKGDHYLLETRGGSTLPHYSGTQFHSTVENLNYAVKVKPLACSQVPTASSNVCYKSLGDSQVTLYNKRREKLKFDVPVSLTLQSITIDSIDSILHTQLAQTSLPECLSERRQCCDLDSASGAVTNLNPADTFSCEDSFKLLFTTMETDCFANWPRSLFKMRLTDQEDGVTQPNNLILTQNSGIKNTFYAMNSLVAFSNAGGSVTFSSSEFSHLHTCGSIVGDSFTELPIPALEQYLSHSYLNLAQLAQIKIVRGFEKTLNTKTVTQTYMDQVSQAKVDQVCAGTAYCTQIVIKDNSKFTHLPFGKSIYSKAQLLSEQNGLRHLGYIINLQNPSAWSSLEVYDTIVEGIKSPVDGCKPYESLLAIDQSRVEAASSLNNFRQLFNPTSAFNKVQIEAPFIVRHHRGPLIFAKNHFRNNISYGGVLSIDQIEGPVVLDQNNFGSNSALLDSSAVSITAGRSAVEADASQKQCGGISISQNVFTNNIGCEDTVGAFSIRCLAATEGWSYNEIMDTHSFDSEGQMEIFTEALSKAELSTVVSSEHSILKQTFNAEYFQVFSNDFSYNYAGTDTAVVSIMGFKTVYYNSNKHFQNENWISNSFRTQSTLFKQQLSDTLPLRVVDPTLIRTRAKTIVHIRAMTTLQARSNNFENNFVLDMHSPHASAGTIQSNGILIQDLDGDIDLSGCVFHRNQGLAGNNRVGIYPVPAGYTSRLIAFQSIKIANFAFDDVSFRSNKGVKEVYKPTTPRAQLFSLEAADFANQVQQVTIRKLQLVANVFINTESAVTFRVQDLQVDDLDLQVNKGDSIIMFEYSNDRAKVRLNRPTAASNEVNQGSTLYVRASVDFNLSGFVAAMMKQKNVFIEHFTVKNGKFTDNFVEKTADMTGSGPRAACIEFAAAAAQAWAFVSISDTILKNNIGVVTNDIYVDETVIQLSLQAITWEGSISQVSSAKLAQVIYRPAHFNFKLLVKSSKFLCTGVSYINDVIMENDVTKVQGRVSLFRLGQAENIEVLPILQKETTSSNELRDGFLNEEDFTLVFEQNTYRKCNHIEKGAVFQLEQGARVLDSRSDYSDCSALSGGLAYVTGHGTYLKLKTPSGHLSEMYAYQGAIVYVEKGATVELFRDVIVRYSEAYEGTVAYVKDRARFIMTTSIDISYNKAHRRGLFYVTDGSQIYLNEARIFGNSGGYDSIILHAENNRVEYHKVDGSTSISAMESTYVKSWLENLDISRNRIAERGRLISIVESNFTVSNSTFTSNEISTDSYGIYASYAEVDIIRSKFVGPTDPYIHYDLDNFEYSDVNGAFVQAQEFSMVWVYKSEFTGGRGIYGGCIMQQGYSRLKIEDCDFYMCTAEYGGAIYASAHRSLEVRRSNFTMNYSFIGYGQNIYSINAYEQLLIEESHFSSYHNSIYTTGYSVSLLSCHFIGDGQTESAHPAIPYHSDGGALFIEQTSRVVVKYTTFKNMSGRYGGAMYINQDRLTNTALTLEKSYRTIRPYYFQGISFENCTAEFDGGAIYVVNPLRMSITTASFRGNSAGNEGGAIQYVCEPTELDLKVDPHTPCALVLDDIAFYENKAFVGGAIRWNLMEMEVQPAVNGPQDDSSQQDTGDEVSRLNFAKSSNGTAVYGSLYFENNKADEYGPEIASVARELIRFETTEKYLKYYEGTSEQRQEFLSAAERVSFFNNYVYDGVQSGGQIPALFLGLIDKYGQIVTINRGSKIEFELRNSTIVSTEFATKILGVTDFFSAYGTYNMSGMGLITAPNNKIAVALKVSGVDLNVPSNRLYLEQQLGREVKPGDTDIGYDLRMKLVVRGCILGEGLRETGACYECPQNTFLLEAPKVPEDCKPCPREKAYCLGGKQVGPQKNYWRSSASSYNFWPCPMQEGQCKGMDTSLPYDAPGNANGLCDTENGYYGVMCTACLPGFKRSGVLKCEKCTSTELFRILAVIVGLVFGVCLLVKMTIAGAEKESDSSVFNKILMNHLQVLIITSDFDMDWPIQVEAIFNVAQPINILTEAIVNFDCFMDTRKLEDVDPYKFELPPDEVRIYSLKVLIMAFLPAGLACLAYITWWIICRIKHQMEVMYTKFIATLVILLFLVHPALTKRMADVFNCTKYDDVYRLNVDYQVNCYTDFRHSQVAYYVALPSIVIWGLGIPAVLYTMMRKKFDKLITPNFKKQFGFLFNGYKPHNYYWEVVIMYRKILCIFVAVFLRPQGIIVQALVLLIMLGVFLQANNTNRPFKTRQLNDIENMSVAAQIITIYCGIFFISAKKRDENFIENRDFYLSESGKILLVMVIAFCNAFFILLWILRFLDMSRDIIRKNYQRLYVFMFLCGRQDKLEKEAVKRAAIIKREKIIASIENTILFLNKMKVIYGNNSCYEDNDRFLRMMYHIEFEMSTLDLTAKRNNFYIQGRRARDRKFDRENLKELANEQSLEVEDDVIAVLGEQREVTEETDVTSKKAACLKQTPFLEYLRKVKIAQKQKIEAQSNPVRQRTVRAQRTLLVPLQHEGSFRSIDPRMTPSPLSRVKSEFHESPMGNRIKLMTCPMDSVDGRPNATPGGQHDSSLTKGISLDDAEGQKSDVSQLFPPPSPGLSLDGNRQSFHFNDFQDPSRFKQIHFDETGNQIEEDDTEGDDFIGGDATSNKGKITNEEAIKKELQKKSKKIKNEIYLDCIEGVSRNQTNLIKRDKKNLTVGKVLNKDRIARLKTSLGDLASKLKSQFESTLGAKSKKKSSLMTKDDPEAHVQELADVDETMSSQENILHKMRQLTDRSGTGPTQMATSKPDTRDLPRQGTEAALNSQTLASADYAQTLGETRRSGGLAGGDHVSEGKTDKQSTEKADEADQEGTEEESEGKDKGPQALVLRLEAQNEQKDDQGYKILRQRDVPRRQLWGDVVEDKILDHSDSFITMQAEDAAEDEGAPDKTVEGDPAETDGAPDKEVAERHTPPLIRDRESYASQFNHLEIEQTPESKFAIQMTPTKKQKDQGETPSKKKAAKQKVLIADHDHIDIPFFDNLVVGRKLPEYKPKNVYDQSDQNSPEKEIKSEDEIYQDDQRISDMTDSLKTSSSMRTYNYEAEEQPAPLIQMPNSRSRLLMDGPSSQLLDDDDNDNEAIGTGLGVSQDIQLRFRKQEHDINESLVYDELA